MQILEKIFNKNGKKTQAKKQKGHKAEKTNSIVNRRNTKKKKSEARVRRLEQIGSRRSFIIYDLWFDG